MTNLNFALKSEGNASEGIPVSPAEISAAVVKMGEDVVHERRTTSHQPDPRIAVDENFSRVSSRMSSVRSSNGVSCHSPITELKVK